MSKLNNKKLNTLSIFVLEILAILAFGVIYTPTKAEAAPALQYSPGHYNADESYTFYSFNWIESVDASSNTSNTTQTQNNENNANSSSGNNSDESKNNNKETVSALASNAIFGSDSFAPSGLIGWLMFAIFILIIVLIVRRYFGGEDRYHSSPLKHA